MGRRVQSWRRDVPAMDVDDVRWSMFPSVRLATVVSPGRLLMRLRVRILRFARPCARGGFCDASGAKADFLLGRCCAASL